MRERERKKEGKGRKRGREREGTMRFSSQLKNPTPSTGKLICSTDGPTKR